MIVAFAGRRSGSMSVDPEPVTAAIRDLLHELTPSAVVGAAADGADLLVLEAAMAMDPPPEIHLVLPTKLEVFVDDSVEADWRERFEAVLEVVPGGGGTVRSLGLSPETNAYREANQVILDTAYGLVGEVEQARLLVIAAPGEGAMIEDIVARAGSMGLETLRIDRSAAAQGAPSPLSR